MYDLLGSHFRQYELMRINAEDKWVRRILCLQTPCLSTIQLDAELKQYNPELRLATASWLLLPTVALPFLRNDEEMLEHVFVFATYKRLAPYNTRISTETNMAWKKMKKELHSGLEKDVEKQTEREVVKEKVVVIQGREASWATEVEDNDGMDLEEEESDEEIVEEIPENQE
ncbi:hypothetical protein L873DRAFT_1843080 [Choiromyces venosus 120613-1]|uniref:Uncharacterized protein n=1 Tax=Choiromyces venosus 120613-1 TaxID=1336337 RepID=A0A3N4JTI4_9PEZI|nr:hypothetical protein L873DRAFT_1843080 [Choiromyces venosus 120613-1]